VLTEADQPDLREMFNRQYTGQPLSNGQLHASERCDDIGNYDHDLVRLGDWASYYISKSEEKGGNS
jgi:transcriptional regulator of met regulon